MNPVFAFTPTDRPNAEITDTSVRFPVRRIFCVGRNYGKHVREMGGDPALDLPIFFTKPADALVNSGVGSGRSIAYPLATTELHHEVELVVAIAKTLHQASPEQANAAIFGYAVGVDLTRRDLQRHAKNNGLPWDSAKAFDQSAPMGPITRNLAHPLTGAIELRVNGQIRQQGQLAHMIWSVPQLLGHLSALFTLQAGDLVFTGTPNGVGPLQVGDTVLGQIDGLSSVEFTII
ncbi:MAG: fumarylacetoacetate hydrolase family protein [Robiginitomaculum sp.]|nr:fumarylacetoacetate hydrolase family protein [Robiginitomaculum sp.]